MVLQKKPKHDHRNYARLRSSGEHDRTPLVVFLMSVSSCRGSFFVLGLLTLVWSAVWLYYYRDNPADHPAIAQSELDEIDDGGPKISSSFVETPWFILLRRMLPVSIVCFCYAWTLWMSLTWLPTYFVQAYSMNIKNSALFSFGVFFAGMVGDTAGGILSDRIFRATGSLERARRDPLIISMLGALCFFIPILFVRDVVVVEICLSGAFSLRS